MKTIFTKVKSIAVQELNHIISDGIQKKYIVLDVRTPVEFAENHINGAVNIELSEFTGKEKMFDDKEEIFVVCKGGVRAGKACQKVTDALSGKMCIVEGGIDAWIKSGFPVKKTRNPRFSIMQQVQIIVGLNCATGALLALTVNKWFAIIPLLFGCGLLFAGLTGICMLLKFLGKAPWNKA